MDASERRVRGKRGLGDLSKEVEASLWPWECWKLEETRPGREQAIDQNANSVEKRENAKRNGAMADRTPDLSHAKRM